MNAAALEFLDRAQGATASLLRLYPKPVSPAAVEIVGGDVTDFVIDCRGHGGKNVEQRVVGCRMVVSYVLKDRGVIGVDVMIVMATVCVVFAGCGCRVG